MGYDVSTLVHTPFRDARICVCLSVYTDLKDGRNVYTQKYSDAYEFSNCSCALLVRQVDASQCRWINN